MAFIQVVGMFDDRGSLQRAKSALIAAGVASDADMRIEPEVTSERPHSPASISDIWRRLKKLLMGESREQIGIYAEGIRRGGLLLVVTVEDDAYQKVKQVMRENGAVELRRRVKRWVAEGWQAFDPAGLGFVEDEIVEERKCVDAETQPLGLDNDNQLRNIRIFDERTGRELGRISEAELAVLQDALEEEGPDDTDYWINPDAIYDLACRPGATPHLIRVLRSAVRNQPNGIDIEFQRDDEARQALDAHHDTRKKGGFS